MSIQSIDPNFLPNLPGFKTRTLPAPGKKQYFKLVDGQVFLKDECIPASSSLDDEGSVTSFGNTTVTKARLQLSLKNANVILKFRAYFEEYVEGTTAAQVRQCDIFFYVDDGSLKVVEKAVVNSGVQQGILVKRGIINKQDGTPFVEEDFRVGEWIVIYGRKFRIVDADGGTRQYLQKTFNITVPPAVFVPYDPHTEYRKAMEPGRDDRWGKFHSKKSESKTFNEALLGHSVDNKGREGFNKFGNTTLKFRCIWDDTQHLYGDVIEFCLAYYLADDSIEIVSIPSSISKEKTRLKLLKRARLPKNFQDTMSLGTKANTEAFFHWSDFYIGMSLEVYGRVLILADGDAITREFFEQQQMPLNEPIVRPPPEVLIHEREVPPPTGFGSEEDSLRSVAGSLLPGPAPVKKLGENKVLSFLASLLSGGVDDIDRRFVITYYVQDQTLKVVEPPVRNSGFTGGVFLSRRAIKSPQGELVTERDIFIGCKLRILKHEFQLLDCSESTLRWMEDKNFPRSNFYFILEKIRPYLYPLAVSGQLSNDFQALESNETGGYKNGNIDGLRKILIQYHLIGGYGLEISEHELRTIVRVNGNRLPYFNYEKLIEQIITPTDEFK